MILTFLLVFRFIIDLKININKFVEQKMRLFVKQVCGQQIILVFYRRWKNISYPNKNLFNSKWKYQIVLLSIGQQIIFQLISRYSTVFSFLFTNSNSMFYTNVKISKMRWKFQTHFNYLIHLQTLWKSKLKSPGFKIDMIITPQWWKNDYSHCKIALLIQ